MSLNGKITRRGNQPLECWEPPSVILAHTHTHTFLGPFHAFLPLIVVSGPFFKVEISLHSAYGKSWITWERHFLKHPSRASLLALAKSLYYKWQYYSRLFLWGPVVQVGLQVLSHPEQRKEGYYANSICTGNLYPGDDTNKTIKEVTRASPHHSSRGPKAKWLATYPPTPRVSWGLTICVVTFAGLGLVPGQSTSPHLITIYPSFITFLWQAFGDRWPR